MLQATIAGKYRMLRLLGEGGMGAVYEAEHTTTGRRLAVKLITLNDPRKKTEVITRFEREARMAGSLDTEHIVQVIDSGEDAGLGMPFMVMELLQGEDLECLTKREGPLAPDLAVRIAVQACIGLRHAHQAGIVHRDIKPANLFLAQRDEGRITVKILDFGIAKGNGLDGGSGKLTRTGTMVGSPYFMSPEQALGEKDVDFRSDIWSLGVVLYAMLTGRTPHEDVESLGQIIMRICSTDAAPVQDRAPWVAPEIAAVVHKALTRERDKRYASAGEMLEALRALTTRGAEITRGMLGPIPPELRARIAPRTSSADLNATVVALSSSGPSSGAFRPASDSLSSSASIAREVRPSPRKMMMLAGSMLAAGIVATLGYTLISKPPAPSEPRPSTEHAAADPVRTGPVVEPVPGGSVSAGKVVSLAISPPAAEVEVAGQRVTVADGKVELRGALGGIVKVKVTAFGQVEERDVVLSESGPVPAKIEVVQRVAATSVKPKDTAAAVTSAPRPEPPRPVKTKPASTVDKNFDQ